MNYTSTQRGEWPTGTHWTEGETRDIVVPDGADAPAWLKPAKAKKPKAKKAE